MNLEIKTESRTSPPIITLLKPNVLSKLNAEVGCWLWRKLVKMGNCLEPLIPPNADWTAIKSFMFTPIILTSHHALEGKKDGQFGADLSHLGFASILAIYSGRRNATKNLLSSCLGRENTSAAEKIHEAIFSPIRKETAQLFHVAWQPQTLFNKNSKTKLIYWQHKFETVIYISYIQKLNLSPKCLSFT